MSYPCEMRLPGCRSMEDPIFNYQNGYMGRTGHEISLQAMCSASSVSKFHEIRSVLGLREDSLTNRSMARFWDSLCMDLVKKMVRIHAPAELQHTYHRRDDDFVQLLHYGLGAASQSVPQKKAPDWLREGEVWKYYAPWQCGCDHFH